MPLVKDTSQYVDILGSDSLDRMELEARRALMAPEVETRQLAAALGWEYVIHLVDEVRRLRGQVQAEFVTASDEKILDVSTGISPMWRTTLDDSQGPK